MGNITALRRRRSGSFSGVRSRNVTSAGPGRSSSLSSAMATVPTSLAWAPPDCRPLKPSRDVVRLFADCRTTSSEADTRARGSMSPCTATRLWLGRLRTPAARGRARRLASCAVNAQYSTGSSQSSHGNNNARPSVLSPGGKSPGGGADVGKRVGRALQALQLEESRGHCDVRGARSLFGEYAADELARLGEILPPGGSRDRWRAAVAAGFALPRARAAQRANLVAGAQYLLNAATRGSAEGGTES